MYTSLLLLLAACTTPPADLSAAASPPPRAALQRSWTRIEPHSTSQVATALPTTPPSALLYQHDPVLSAGLLLIERVGDELVTSPAPISAGSVSQAKVADVTGDGAPDLLLRTTDSIRVYDPTTWTLLHRLRMLTDERDVPHPMWPIQLDADPASELLVMTEYGVAHYELDGSLVGFLSHSATGYVAQLDADSAPELLYDYPPMVLDGRTFQPEPVQIPLAGFLRPGPDLDGDGVQELLQQGSWDGQLLNLARGHVTPVRMGPTVVNDELLMVDAHHDGTDELWMATANGPQWVIADPATGQVLDGVPAITTRPSSATTALWDSDGDGVDEILYGSAGWLGLADTVELDWITRNRVVAAGDLTLADIDGDGQQELIECSPGQLIVRDPDTAARTGQFALPPEFDPVVFCQAGDIDGDGTSEIALANLRETWVFDLDAGVATSLYRHPGGGDDMLLQDATGDGRADLIWRDQTMCVAAGGVSTTWCSAFSAIGPLDVADLNGDGLLELIAGSGGGDTTVFDGATGATIAVQPTQVGLARTTQHMGRTLLVAAREFTAGQGTDLWAWELVGNQLVERTTARIPRFHPYSLRTDGTKVWLGGFDGVLRFDLLTGATEIDDIGYIDLDTAAVLRPQVLLARVTDGWIAWTR